MEDSPRLNGEDNNDKENERDDSSKSRSPQDFLSRWRRFTAKDSELQSSFSVYEKPKEHEARQDDDEKTEDEDEDGAEHLSKSVKKRMRRLRRHLGPFLPQKKELKEDPAVLLELPVPDETEEAREEPLSQFVVENLTPDRQTDFDLPQGIAEDSAPSSVERSIRESAQNAEEEGSNPKSSEISSDGPPKHVLIPETESIEDILQRREREVEQIQERNQALHATSTDRSSSEMSTAGNVDTAPTSAEIVQHNAPIGGLLAVDLLNYSVAKKRDQKNKILNEKQHEQLKKDQKRESDATKERINMLELQHNQRQKVLEKSSKDSIPQVAAVTNEVIYNRNSQIKEAVDTKKPEHISVTQEQVVKPNPETAKNGDRPPQTATTFENTLQRVHEAEKGKISSEFQFERRHEVMDEPGGSRDHAPNMTSPHEYDPASIMQSRSTSKSSGQDYSVGGSKQSDESRQPVYKQAAVTGFWGAVVGIIVFIIMYMLAS